MVSTADEHGDLYILGGSSRTARSAGEFTPFAGLCKKEKTKHLTCLATLVSHVHTVKHSEFNFSIYVRSLFRVY